MSAAHIVLFQYFQDKTEENHKTSSQNGWNLGKNGTRIFQNSSRDFNAKATKFCRLVVCWFVTCDSFI